MRANNCNLQDRLQEGEHEITCYIDIRGGTRSHRAGRGANGKMGSDQTAKSLIDMERKWAEASCTHSLIVQDILADDFQGTSPDGGKRYSKKGAVEEAKKLRRTTRGIAV